MSNRPRKRSAIHVLRKPDALELHSKEWLKEQLRSAFYTQAHQLRPSESAFELRNNRKLITPDLLFGLLHWWALVTYLYGISWTIGAVVLGDPHGVLWKPMQLFKLSYPMLPVILTCWFCRYKFDLGRRMTPGYYFANLKMGLMPSLGPGMLIGVVLDKVIVRPKYKPFEVGPEYHAFMLAFAWILGCNLWLLIKFAGRIMFCLPPKNEEERRKDWGLYARWYLEPFNGLGPTRTLKPWREWLQTGPHTIFFDIIPAPEHGTFHKIGKANMHLSIGVTICCVLMWVLLLVWWVVLSTEEWKKWWRANVHRTLSPGFERAEFDAMIVETDFPNLFFNSLTAPVLVWGTWRKEPVPSDLARVPSVPSLQAEKSFPLVPTKSTYVTIEDKQHHAILLNKTDEDAEQEDLLDEVASIVMRLSLTDIMHDDGLRDLVLSGGLRKAAK